MNTRDIKRPSIVVLGGGTGSNTLLKSLRSLTPDVDITAIVSMADDGGSTGILRNELGVLPAGDIRQCLVALAESSDVGELFDYRFDEGSLDGHAFGNIFLAALEKVTGSFSSAVEVASQALNVNGRVLPVTLDNVRLHMKLGRKIIKGEHMIDPLMFQSEARPDLSLYPSAHIYIEAEKAILDADMVVLAPGDIYTSLGPLLIVDGVAETLVKTNAKVVYVCNLITKKGQTDNLTVADHAAEIERFAGKPILDYVLYNDAQFSEAFLAESGMSHTLVSVQPDQFIGRSYIAIGRPLLTDIAPEMNSHDYLSSLRSPVRHDLNRVAQTLEAILNVSSVKANY